MITRKDMENCILDFFTRLNKEYNEQKLCPIKVRVELGLLPKTIKFWEYNYVEKIYIEVKDLKVIEFETYIRNFLHNL